MTVLAAMGWAYLSVALYFVVAPVVQGQRLSAPCYTYAALLTQLAGLAIMALLWLPVRLYLMTCPAPGAGAYVRSNLIRSSGSFVALAMLWLALPPAVGRI